MRREQELLTSFLRQKGLKQTSQREKILDVFLSGGKHISADELHVIIRKIDPRIGFSTVYRTLRLLTDCGLAREVNFGDGRARFEKAFDRGQHGHLICTNCGKAEEFTIPAMDKTIKQIAGTVGFRPEGHRFEVYGFCKRCQ